MSYQNRKNARGSRVKALPVGASYGSSSSYASTTKNPFGPGLAEEFFDVENGYDDDCEVMDDGYYGRVVADVDDADLFNGETHSYHYRHQSELMLETPEELSTRLTQQIRRWERAYRKMAIYALKWHYLEEEADENPQVAKMFKDLQMFRKLAGSDRV